VADYFTGVVDQAAVITMLDTYKLIRDQYTADQWEEIVDQAWQALYGQPRVVTLLAVGWPSATG
jgi:hypothetical protein